MKKEPAVITAVLAAIAQAVMIYLTGDTEADITWLGPILTLIAGFLTRQNVFSENTVREAGFTPHELMKRANNPSISPPKGD